MTINIFACSYYFDLNDGIMGEFDELMIDTFTMAMGYLGKYHRIENEEQPNRTLLNLVIEGKLREEVIFVCTQETGEFCNLNNG